MTTKIRLEGFISSWDVSNKLLLRQLPKDKSEPVHIFVDSVGGDAFEGFAIFNTLLNRDNVTVEIGARAISAASYIPFAADRVIVSKISTWMAHNAQTFMYGDKREARTTLNFLEGIDGIIVGIYEGHIRNMKRSDIVSKMDEEYWLFGGQDIIDAGIADEMGSGSGGGTGEGEQQEDLNTTDVMENFRAVFAEKMSHRPDQPRDWKALNVIVDNFRKRKEVKQMATENTQVPTVSAANVPAAPAPAAPAPAAPAPAAPVDNTKAIEEAVANEQKRILKLLNLGSVQISETIQTAIVGNMSQGDYAIAQLEADKAKVPASNADGMALPPAPNPNETANNLPKEQTDADKNVAGGKKLAQNLWPKDEK